MAATATVQFRLDPEKKKAAEELFNGMGLTMTTAFALFIQQSLNCNGLPFRVVGKQEADSNLLKDKDVDERSGLKQKIVSSPKRKLGVLNGQMWMADDFDAPLEDFKEYM